MKRRIKALIVCLALVMTGCLAGCGEDGNTSASNTAGQTSVNEPTAAPTAEPTAVPTAEPTAAPSNAERPSMDASLMNKPESGDYIELALNVYYNDASANYYSNEKGKSIFVTKEGQYTLVFDCTEDLSDAAQNAGVKFLQNLTAVYIQDAGVANANQSPLKACDIMFDAVVVDDTALTVTQSAPKSAFKSTGVFDTNDPINGWDGSQVAEVAAGSDHAANFTTVTKPTFIAVTFTLSNLKWTGDEADSEPTPEPTNIPAQSQDGENNTVFSNIDFTNMNSVELTKLLGNGINLGNTMEAYGHATLGALARVSQYETYWGQPLTTEAMLKGMKAAGFDTIRIPVSWTNTMNYENGDYTISEAFLARVEEIVNYALDAEMFVIVNDHWDGGWYSMFGSKTPETVQKAWDLYESMWTQIATRFKDYPDMLIFESANEELGNALNDNSSCADSGYLTEEGKFETTNAINQKFVDVVRATGGNNDDRFLLIAGYNTNIDLTCDNRFKMPNDTASGKLFISVHYYDPSNYALAEKQARWGIKSEYEYMDSQLAKMSKFVDAGYGVIIGEYGALPVWEDNAPVPKENMLEYHTHFLDNCDVYNFCPVLWSCNDFFRKVQLTMINDDMANLYAGRSYAKEIEAGDAYIDTVKARRDADTANAVDMWDDVEVVEDGTPVAWIMWNGGAGTYSVGDTFNPADNTQGITAHNVVIDGYGEYEVSLDFAGGNDGLTFGALAIAYGETLYPGAVINITEVTYDGNPVTLVAQPYTSSDDGKCTRVNLINEWVTKVPEGARAMPGALTGASSVILDKTQIVGIKNITIKFRLINIPK